VNALLTWEHRAASLDSDDWVLIPIELELAGAVTLVASASGKLAGHQHHDKPPPFSFGYGISWVIQDSLTGDDWHWLTGGLLVPSDARQIRRISSPTGTSARLGLKSYVVAAMDGTNRNFEGATGWSYIWNDMELTKPTDVLVNIAVRSLQ
jgi:hypothetical protein